MFQHPFITELDRSEYATQASKTIIFNAMVFPVPRLGNMIQDGIRIDDRMVTKIGL